MARRFVGHQTQITSAFVALHHRAFFLNQTFNGEQMKELVAQEYLDNAKQSAAVMYRDDTAQNRLAFHVGVLEGYIIQMVNVINSSTSLIETLQAQIKEMKNESI